MPLILVKESYFFKRGYGFSRIPTISQQGKGYSPALATRSLPRSWLRAGWCLPCQPMKQPRRRKPGCFWKFWCMSWNWKWSQIIHFFVWDMVWHDFFWRITELIFVHTECNCSVSYEFGEVKIGIGELFLFLCISLRIFGMCTGGVWVSITGFWPLTLIGTVPNPHRKDPRVQEGLRGLRRDHIINHCSHILDRCGST